jgi:hypothetical protein
MIGPSRKTWFPHNGKWLGFTDAELGTMPPDDQQAIREIVEEYEKNRLASFLPHGQGRDFLNDWTNNICMMVAPTRTGKSALGTAFTCLRAIPTDKRWPIFAENGIEWHEWRGKMRYVISSYSLDNLEEVWKEYQNWLPRYELGKYAADWGKYPGENGAPKKVSLLDGRTKRVLLTCGSELIFLCDTMSQANWEGKRWDGGHFDEQREEEKFIGWLRGTSNTSGTVQCCFTLTGHILEGRPDTGAGGWIKRKLWDGTYNFGCTIGRYRMSIEDAPECVLSKDTKAQLRRQWVDEPRAIGDVKKMRQAEARYFGGWESGSGLVLDNFNRKYHLIPRFAIPSDWTLYRGMDHGRESPMAVLWMAVTPWGDWVCFREYYVPSRTIPVHAKAVAEMSGSTRELISTGSDESGATWPVYNEVFGREHYFASVMDSRSFIRKTDERNITIGQMYNDNGLNCTKASGAHNEMVIPQTNAALEIDYSRQHIMVQLRQHGLISADTYKHWLTQVDGRTDCGSRLYFMGDLKHTVTEIEGWQNNVTTGNALAWGRPSDKDDHLMSALKFLVAEQPRYMGEYARPMDVDDGPEEYASGYKYL